MYDFDLDAIVIDGVAIPRQEMNVKGLRSSQENDNPRHILAALGVITLVYQGVEYPLGAWKDIDEDTRFMLAEWLSPT